MSERMADVLYGISFGVGILAFMFMGAGFLGSSPIFFPALGIMIVAIVVCGELDKR